MQNRLSQITSQSNKKKIDQIFFILSLMFDGSIEQGELIKVPSVEFGKKMIESFRGYIYGTSTN